MLYDYEIGTSVSPRARALLRARRARRRRLWTASTRWRRFTPPGPQNEYVCGGPINRGRLHIHGIQAVTGSRLAGRLASGRNQATADPEAAEPADTPRSSERGLTGGSYLQRGLNGAGIADACRLMPRRTPTADVRRSIWVYMAATEVQVVALRDTAATVQLHPCGSTLGCARTVLHALGCRNSGCRNSSCRNSAAEILHPHRNLRAAANTAASVQLQPGLQQHARMCSRSATCTWLQKFWLQKFCCRQAAKKSQCTHFDQHSGIVW